MKVKFSGRRAERHPRHERHCRTEFACVEGVCGQLAAERQFHITLCRYHVAENKFREADFVASLDPSSLPPGSQQAGIQFLHMNSCYVVPSKGTDQPVTTLVNDAEFEVLPNVMESGVFLMQTLAAPHNSSKQLLLF
jgi:hypothetical protein